MKRLLFVALVGCALTSKAPPRELRYFAPEAEVSPSAHVTPCARIRLGHITPSAHLRHAIEHRVAALEIAPYDHLGWTETPDAYVRRALVHALFEARPLEEATAGRVAVLDVDVLAFEQVGPAGRVVLRYELRDDTRVIARGTVAVDRPASSRDIDRVVSAIGTALTAASGQLADRVVAAACARDAG